eukprot:177806_1
MAHHLRRQSLRWMRRFSLSIWHSSVQHRHYNGVTQLGRKISKHTEYTNNNCNILHFTKKRFSYDWDEMARMIDKEPSTTSAETVQSKRNDPNASYIIIDVREDSELKQRKLDKNDWIHIQKDNILNTKSVEKIAELGCDKSKYKEIYILCRSGVRANLVAGHLNELGFDNVSVIEGGLLAWKD